MLPKTQRVKKESFPEIYKKGQAFHSKNFSLFVLSIPGQKSAFSFVVSSKIIRKATERNKIKRRSRAIVEKNLPSLKKGHALVFVLKSYNNKTTFQELEENICQLLKKANIL